MIHQNEMLCVPSIKWLGVYPTDIILLNLHSISLTDRDQAKVKSLLKRSYIISNDKLLQQVLLKIRIYVIIYAHYLLLYLFTNNSSINIRYILIYLILPTFQLKIQFFIILGINVTSVK